jgi:hypothetical protein
MNQALRLSVPADPAFSVTVRVFVAACARRVGLAEEETDDLRLVATELLGVAVDNGRDLLDLEVQAAADGWTLAADVGPIDRPETQGDGIAIRRIDVLEAIAQVDADGDRVICSGPRAADQA